MTTNRALAAMQLAKAQKAQEAPNQSQKTTLGNAPITPPKTNLFDDTAKTTPKTELKPAYLNSSLAKSENEQTPAQRLVRVDLSIAGTPHRISCPADDVNTLNRHAEQLNSSLKEIRRTIGNKSPSNEELLVLHCLELYDQLGDLKKQSQDYQINQERSNVMLDKLIKDVNAMIKPQ